MKQIVFLGIKHSGKTTQGKLLAAALGTPFADSDELLAQSYRERHGEALPVREIMKRHGAEFFRRLEAETVRTLCPGRDRVLALGGGVPVNPFLDEPALKNLGFLIWLDVDAETAFARILEGGIPPFLAGDDPHETFLKQYRERAARYRELADWRLPIAPGAAPEEVHRQIAGELKELGMI